MIDYYPYADLNDKVNAYKSEIAHSLSNAVHPEHLTRVYKKLDALKKFWEESMTAQTKEEK